MFFGKGGVQSHSRSQALLFHGAPSVLQQVQLAAVGWQLAFVTWSVGMVSSKVGW